MKISRFNSTQMRSKGARLNAPVAQQQLPSDQVTLGESEWTFSKGFKGAARGAARGAGLGLVLDVAGMGIPGMLGYAATGTMTGALIGLAVLPTAGALIHGLHGFASPDTAGS